MKLTALLLLAPLAACASPYGDDNSHVGDLLQGDALELSVQAGWGSATALDVGLQNSTQDGACLGLSSSVSATANGVAATVFPGDTSQQELGTKTFCPYLHWDDVSALGDTLTVVIVDNSRASSDPYRSVSFTVHNPTQVGSLTWDGSSDDSVVHAVHAGDRVHLQAPVAEVVDSATWEIDPMPVCTWSGNVETCTFYDPSAQGDATLAQGEVDIDVPASGARGSELLHVETTGHLPVAGCVHATCDDVLVVQDAPFTLEGS